MNTDQAHLSPEEKEGGFVDDPNPFIGQPTVKIGEVMNNPTEQDTKLNTVRTFQSDLAGAVKSDNVSMIKIALAEKERREKSNSYTEISSTPRIAKAYIVAGVLMLLIFGGAGYAFVHFNRPPAPTLEEQIAPLEPEIIYSESQKLISIDGNTPEALFGEIRSITGESFDLGSVKRIMLTTSTATSTRNITAQEFFSFIKTRTPDELLRSIEPFFFLGSYAYNPNDTILIAKISSYDNAYAAMLNWEPYMDTDIGGLFISTSFTAQGALTENTQTNQTPEITPTRNATATEGGVAREGETARSSSTSTTTPIASTTQNLAVNTTTTGTQRDRTISMFKDKIIHNKDTRALTAPNGQIKFLYSFIDKKTLVITTSENGLKEALYRTTTGRIIR